MTREELKRSGLLDQYVLGLADPEQCAEIERMLQEDPFLAGEVDRLRADLNAYADARNIGPPPAGRAPRTAEEFQDLDHEMILAMMERNHSLNMWRYVMVAVCLLLLGFSGYLFRLKENVQAELVRERALHAQDDASYELDIEKSRAALAEAAVHWENLRTVNTEVATGSMRVHLVEDKGIALVDLSDILPPEEGHAYYVYSQGGEDTEPAVVITADRQQGLFPVHLEEGDGGIRVYHWRVDERPVPPLPADDLIAELHLGTPD